MKRWNSADEVLDFAVKREEGAVRFYRVLAEKADSDATRELFEEFAQEELQHKAKLLAVKQDGSMEGAAGKIVDLKIGDYLVDTKIDSDLSYQEALILAMKREKAAFRLYTDLAAATTDADLRGLLLSLAQEEAKHKLRFEVEYDEHVLTEN